MAYWDAMVHFETENHRAAFLVESPNYDQAEAFVKVLVKEKYPNETIKELTVRISKTNREQRRKLKVRAHK